MRRGLLVTALAITAAAAPSAAIITRHDVSDERYVASGREFETIVGTGEVPRENGVATGTGTLIGRGWVLTAAHVVSVVKSGERASFTLAGVDHPVAEIVVSPGWDRDRRPAGDDIALLRLAAPVPNAGAGCLYRGSNERGLMVTVAGRGGQGDGLSCALPRERWDRRLRAATVRIDAVEDDTVSWRFKQPASAVSRRWKASPVQATAAGRPSSNSADAGAWSASRRRRRATATNARGNMASPNSMPEYRAPRLARRKNADGAVPSLKW